MTTHYWDEIVEVLAEHKAPMRVKEVVDALHGRPAYEKWVTETYSDDGYKSEGTQNGLVWRSLVNMLYGHEEVVQRIGRKYCIHPAWDGVPLSGRRRVDGQRDPYGMVNYNINGEPHDQSGRHREKPEPVEEMTTGGVYLVRVDNNIPVEEILLAIAEMPGVNVTMV